MEGALSGVKVLDLSSTCRPIRLSEPSRFGGRGPENRGSMGRRHKIMGPPVHERLRREGRRSLLLSCNRGKQIIRMNLKEQTRELQHLISQADVIVENFRPGTFDRLVPELPGDKILCSISGYGATGPRSSEPGYDLSLQARSGIMSITGENGRPPVKVGVAWIDVITGLQATSAIIAALFHRERTGLGQRIDISLWDCAIAALVNQAQNRIATGEDPRPMASAHLTLYHTGPSKPLMGGSSSL